MSLASRRPIALGLLAGAVALALALTASEASAAPPFVVKSAKHKDGPYAETTFPPPGVAINPGKTKSLFFKIVANAGQPEVTFTDAATPNPHPDGFRVKWFRGKTNVSTEVKGVGYDLIVEFGHPKVFRARVKALAPGDFCLGGQATTNVPTPFEDDEYFGVNGNSCA